MMFQKCLQRMGIVFTVSILVCALFFVSNTFANSQVTLVTCDEYGNTGLSDSSFAKATITISDLDSSGNYNYYGADVGTFEIPVNNTASHIYTTRVPTNNLSFQITDFGDLSKYQDSKIYVLGYRVLYQSIGDSSGNIIESSWKVDSNSYFKAITNNHPFITCDSAGNIDSNDKSFAIANITVADLDTSGNYTHYGTDIGVFKAPLAGNVSDVVNTTRNITNNLSFQITDFGTLSNYLDNQVYVLGYRVLYQPISDDGLNIVESLWKMDTNSYFRLYPQIADEFVTCEQLGYVRTTDKIFTQANIIVTELDTSGNYIHYGTDIGVFKAPLAGNVSDIMNVTRNITDNLSFEINDFGTLSNYQDNQVYVLGYRVLYQPISDDGLNIVESTWEMVPNSYFRLMPKDLQHFQSINYNYRGQLKTVEVKEPDNSDLQGDELEVFNLWNTFIDGDLLTYKVKFNLVNLSELQNIDVNLSMNNLNIPDVELVVSNAEINGKTFDLTNSKQSPNIYSLRLLISDLKQGDNYLVYKARLKLKKFSNNFATITNNATVFGMTNDGSLIQIGIPFSLNCDVITKIYKGEVVYR